MKTVVKKGLTVAFSFANQQQYQKLPDFYPSVSVNNEIYATFALTLHVFNCSSVSFILSITIYMVILSFSFFLGGNQHYYIMHTPVEIGPSNASSG